MNLKIAIATLAACTMLTGTALADSPKHNKKQNRGQATSTSVTGGVTAAGPNGAVAGGVSGAQGTTQTSDRNRRTRMQAPSTASTNTSGAVYTTRDSGSAAINTGGAASGSGAVRSSSEGEVYSSTDRQGSEADAYGNSEAEADGPNRF
jgi:hypothetical protein